MNISLPELPQACFELEVFIGDRPVGIIEWHQDSVLFQYYPGTRDTDFVSLLMPVRSQPSFSPLPGVLPPVFDMNLPEGSLRQTLVGRYGKVVQGFNDLALLRLVGLSPTYDLCTTNAYLPADMLALSLDGSKRYPSAQRLVKFATRHCGLSLSETDDVFKQVREGISAAQAELRSYCQANPAFGDTVGSTMLALWQAGLSASLPASIN